MKYLVEQTDRSKDNFTNMNFKVEESFNLFKIFLDFGETKDIHWKEEKSRKQVDTQLNYKTGILLF